MSEQPDSPAAGANETAPPESTTTAATAVDNPPITEPSTAPTESSTAPSSAQEPAAESSTTAGASTASSPVESSRPASSQPEPSASEAAPKSTSAKGAASSASSKIKSAQSASKTDKAASKTEKAASASSRTEGESKRGASQSATPSPSASQGTNTTSGGTREHRRKRMKLGELDLQTAKIGFLGAGKMTESTINGLIHYAKISPKRIHVAAPSSKNLERFKTLGCRVTKRNYDIFGRYDCDIVFLCFHGFVIKHCYKLGGQRPHPLTTNYIPHQRHPVYILSLVSGVSLSQIKACLLNPESTNKYVVEIHRIMMNTAVGHGLGICAVDCEPDSKKLSAPLRQLLSSIAQLDHVPASQMDAACAIGGSGLAFAYYFINSLADGAFKMGLSRQQAIRFASKTAQCAAQTMMESGKHPAELRDNVSSPSGAAIYGIHVLEKNDVASGVTAAVEAAHKRANDLANQDVSL